MVAETRSLHRKLAQVMYEAERIPKNGTAPREMGGYKFVEVGDAADFIRKSLAEKVITMMPTNVTVVGQSEHATRGGGSMTIVDLITEWTLTDGESGESITIMSYGAGGDVGDKYSGKASTSAMKYALLTGFLLSTGDDSERGTLPERKPREQSAIGAQSEPSDRPELERRADGLMGTAIAGSSPADLELRYDPDSVAFWGFKLKSGKIAYQAFATGALAEALATAHAVEPITGTDVTVWGRIEMVPWRKGDRDMPPYARIVIERMSAGDWTLPAAEPPTMFGGDDA